MCLLPYLASGLSYLTGLQIFAHSPKMEKYCLKLSSSINYAIALLSILHKSFTHREKKNDKTNINAEYLVTYKLFLQHSLEVTMSCFLQTPSKSDWKCFKLEQNLLILFFLNTMGCRMIEIHLFKYPHSS